MGNRGGFSWKRLTGISGAKAKLSRRTGIPFTKSGRQRKVGKLLTGGRFGCALPIMIAVIVLAGVACSSRATIAPTAPAQRVATVAIATALPSATAVPPTATQPLAATITPSVVTATPGAGYSCERCIKGNLSSDGRRLYHLPSCSSYAATVIDEKKGERWFSTEAEAKAAGWSKASTCR